jgi:pyruvate formate lyase activating enzyme
MKQQRATAAGRISRRAFLKGLAGTGLCALGAGALWADWRWASDIRPPGPDLPAHAREALYYDGLGDSGVVQEAVASAQGAGLDCASCHAPTEPSPTLYCHVPHQGSYVRCSLCPHRCVLAEGERGLCRVRENQDGKLYTLAYANPCAVHVDPIEKKPFFHFLPGTLAFSLATAGCSLRCKYCQNHDIAQHPPEEVRSYDAPPEAIVAASLQQSARSVAYTYSEPMVFYEYMLDTARLARRARLRNVVISAGYVNPEPLRELCHVVDAIKIDLKGNNEDFYREVCGGTLGPVKAALQLIHDLGVHLEIVNLVVPSLNDDPSELKALVEWVLDALGPDVPLHFSRFHPDYQLTHLPPTPIETMEKARQTALDAGIHYVYLGNVPGHEGNHTFCPTCGELIVERAGMATLSLHIVDGLCTYCHTPIPGVWK